MSLFDFGLSMEEPDLLYVGDIDLVYDPASECGEWTYWIVDNCFTDWCEDFVSIDSDFIHICHAYRQWPWDTFDEGCVLE
jgi:hypothetical protein